MMDEYILRCYPMFLSYICCVIFVALCWCCGLRVLWLIKLILQSEMGCSSPQNASMPNIPAHHLNRLLQVSQINHSLNVNKKYEHLSKIKQDQYAGQGFKKTYAYECMTTVQELSSKRKEYWVLLYTETRVNGYPECWQAIHAAVEEPDQNTGFTILESVRISMLKNNIQMCVDSKFNKYEVPIFCINEPLSYGQQTMAEKNLNLEYSSQNVQVKIRTVKFPNEDVALQLNTSTTVGDVKLALRKQKQIPDVQNIRLFYNGREMIDSKTLGNYSYAVGTMIQGMIR